MKADLDEIQKRYDADRARLEARQSVINAETSEILRAGLVPFDVVAGAFNIATGRGKVRDLLSTASVIPFGAILRRTNGIVQLGGGYGAMKRLLKGEGILGIELHHIPSKASLELAGIPISQSRASVVAQRVIDHRATKSWGSSLESGEFRREVAALLARGDVEGALRIEFGDIERINGRTYDYGVEDMARYIHDDLKNFKR